jgi:hypothetical protein
VRLAATATSAAVCMFFNEGVAVAQSKFISETQISAAIGELSEMYGDSHTPRIEKGVRQVAGFWREDDGAPDEFADFCRENYIADPAIRQQTADRFETAFASVYGHMQEMGRDLSWNLDIDTGPLLPIDYAFGRLSPGAHLEEDMFKTKIAFIALLNYPLHTLDECLQSGPMWSREEWAQSRMAGQFSARVPPEVSQRISETYVAADTYIGQYNIFMHHLLTPGGQRPFPEGLRLITHWNLRDELKSQYSEAGGLPKQEMIYQVMLKIIRQEIPTAVINNPAVDWNVATDEVTVAPVVDGDIPAHWTMAGEPGDPVDNTREPDTRYAHLLAVFHAQQQADPFYPTMPTMIGRRFQQNFEIPEDTVVAILKSILSSKTVARTASLIKKRLGRDLRPFDIWYDGFKTRGSIAEAELDRVVNEKYPSVESFQADLPYILQKLGFTPPKAEYLVSHIAVDPARGIGHAMSPGRRADKARLRTRIGESGMDYKGYNIAIHEFGHNVEQVFSLNDVDHTLLRGVPNTAFTEGFAFVFQARDLELLGLEGNDPLAEHLKTLDVFWGTYEIGGVALVDIGVWNWMYQHPDATPAELRDATIAIARNVWNEFYAPVFGVKDAEILAVYSHMIDNALYLPNYPLGHIIAFQVEEHMKGGDMAQEMERMCKIGSVTPDLWMKEAVGGPISSAPMLKAAEDAMIALSE